MVGNGAANELPTETEITTTSNVGCKRKRWISDWDSRLRSKIATMLPTGTPLLPPAIDLRRRHVSSENARDLLKDSLANIYVSAAKVQAMQAELIAAKDTIKVLEASTQEWKNYAEMLRDQREEYKTSLNLAQAELDNLQKSIASSASMVTREFEENMDMLSTQLEEKVEDIQDMESLNNILVVKERITNDELQEARKELINGSQDFLSDHTLIGIKRMGELNEKPFRDVCMQKFSTEEWSTKSAELCSLWQENIKNSQWFPFKVIAKTNGEFDEIIEDNDEKLKQLKEDWGEQVYDAVCVALIEINEYNSSTRYPVPELWNFKENRRARVGEGINYLVKKLNSLKKPKRRGR